MGTIRLRNPHSVLAALEKRPRDVQQILVPAALMDPKAAPRDGRDAWAKVVQKAKSLGIPVQNAPKSAPDRDSRGGGEGGRDGRASVTEAVVLERAGVPVEQLFANARERRGGKGLWLALDCLTDPHNVGAIFRTASFFGVEGILLTEERSAPLTGTVYDIASGGMETVPFTQQINLQRAFELAKDQGLWILGTSEHGGETLRTIQPDRPWLLVLGNEEKGMRRLTAEACDVTCQIPPASAQAVTSLNVSVAAGVLIGRLSP
jgi:23S rRNA (guanosine2251-2'-O)-methyltransferase